MNLTRRQISAVIKLYYKTQSSVKVMRIMQKEFPGLKQHSKQYILRIVRRFEKTGSIQDTKHSNEGRPRSVRKLDAIHDHEVRKLIEETPQKSLREVLGGVSNRVTYSRTSVHRILRFDLHLSFLSEWNCE